MSEINDIDKKLDKLLGNTGGGNSTVSSSSTTVRRERYSDLDIPNTTPTRSADANKKKMLLRLIDTKGKPATTVTDPRLLELGITSVDTALDLIDHNLLKMTWGTNLNNVVAVYNPNTNKVRHSTVGIDKKKRTPTFDWSDAIVQDGRYKNIANVNGGIESGANNINLLGYRNRENVSINTNNKAISSGSVNNSNNPNLIKETYKAEIHGYYTNTHAPVTKGSLRNRIYNPTLDKPESTRLDENGIVRYGMGKDAPWRKGVFNYSNYNLEGFLNSVGLTYDRMLSRILTLDNINKNKLINPIDVINFGRCYVFFTKPDLYLFMDGDGTINPSIEANCPDLYIKIKRNPQVARQLQSIYSNAPVTSSDKGFMHLLGSMCTSVPYADLGISEKLAAKNKFELGIKYGGDFINSLKENELSLSFMDLRTRDVSTLFEIWTEYISGLSRGKIYPKRHYRDGNIIDYAISIYTFVLDEVNNIVAHGSLVGCFPKSLNTTLLEYTRDSITADKFLGPFTYQWQVSHVTMPNAHSTIEAFNYASGFSKIQSRVDSGNTFGVGYARSYKSVFFGAKTNKSGGMSLAEQKSSTKVKYIMHHSIEAWGRDIIRFSPTHEDDVYKNYQHQLTITEYWPEYAGVVASINDYGINQYSLVFFSSEEYLGVPNDYSDLINLDAYDNVSPLRGKAVMGLNGVKLNYIFWARYNSLGIGYMDERYRDIEEYLVDPVYRRFVVDGTASLLYGISGGNISYAKKGSDMSNGASRYDRRGNADNNFNMSDKGTRINNVLNSLWVNK